MKFAEAISVYEQALALEPNHPSAWTNLADSFLQVGNWQDACDAANRQIALRPGHIGALSLKSVALQELGSTNAWREIVDLTVWSAASILHRTRRSFRIYKRSIMHWRTIAGDIRALPMNRPTIRRRSDGVLELSARRREGCYCLALLYRGLRKSIWRPARSILHIRTFGQRPAGWDYFLWGTVFGAQGHQVSHVHPDGWLSGVYHVVVPPSIDNDLKAENRNVLIEFEPKSGLSEVKGRPRNQKCSNLSKDALSVSVLFLPSDDTVRIRNEARQSGLDLMPRA